MRRLIGSRVYSTHKRQDQQELAKKKKVEKKQVIYVGQFRELPSVSIYMSDAYSDTDEHLLRTETRAERISPTKEKSLISHWPTYVPCQSVRNIILKSRVLKSDRLK